MFTDESRESEWTNLRQPCVIKCDKKSYKETAMELTRLKFQRLLLKSQKTLKNKKKSKKRNRKHAGNKSYKKQRLNCTKSKR